MIVNLQLPKQRRSKIKFGKDIMDDILLELTLVKDTYEYNKERVAAIDGEINFILHELECKEFNQKEINKRFKILKKLRVERRVLLNEKATLSPIYTALQQKEFNVKRMIEIRETVVQRVEDLKNRGKMDSQYTALVDFYQEANSGLRIGKQFTQVSQVE
jgi:hypothetical protein